MAHLGEQPVVDVLRLRFALAILTLEIVACSIQAPGQLPTVEATRTPLALAIAPKAQIANATVTAMQSLNVRAGPSRTYGAIGALYSGARVELTGKCTRGWAEITWDDSSAWVYSEYLSDNSCKERKP